jgi:hypothetical protein
MWAHLHRQAVDRAMTALLTHPGCTCEPTTFDSHTIERFSLWNIHVFGVTPHPQCKITVTNMPQSSSGEHKIKLLGVMISEEKGAHGGNLCCFFHD